MSPKKLQVDIAPTDADVAHKLVVHHLALAMGYFQAVSEEEALALLSHEIAHTFQGFNLEKEVAQNFANDINARYAALSEEMDG